VPATIAFKMRRPLAPKISVMTEDSLTLGFLEHGLDALSVLHDLAGQLLPGPRQIAHFLDRLGRARDVRSVLISVGANIKPS
jgi:hypothetical protein